EQRALVAAALDLVSRARIGMRTPIVTTIAPARIAGLVAGPIAGLMAGAPVALHGPFSGRAFAALLEDLAGAHLVVPGALLPALAAAGLYDQRVAASVLLLERCGSARELADVPARRRRPAAAAPLWSTWWRWRSTPSSRSRAARTARRFPCWTSRII
ncbi:MAG TPA: hypothetical protein VIL72_06950, partial [Beijerinckiaceae bacterium]